MPPSKIRVRQESFNRQLGLSVETLHTLLGKPHDATYIDVDHASFACIEGRETEPVLGTPGMTPSCAHCAPRCLWNNVSDGCSCSLCVCCGVRWIRGGCGDWTADVSHTSTVD
jgi:hypothetical protein